MKRQLLVLIALATLASALTTNAFGQTGKRAAANVTFDFQIGDRTFPAGEYWIESLSRLSDSILQIRSVRDPSKNEIIVTNHSNGQKQTPRLVFKKYGEDYFLSRVFLDTDQSSYSIRPSRRQRESEKGLTLASLEKN